MESRRWISAPTGLRPARLRPLPTPISSRRSRQGFCYKRQGRGCLHETPRRFTWGSDSVWALGSPSAIGWLFGDLEEINPRTQARQPSPPPAAVTAGKANFDSRLRKNKAFPCRNSASHPGPSTLGWWWGGSYFDTFTSVMKTILRVQGCCIITSLYPTSITERRGESEKTAIFSYIPTSCLYSPGLRRIYHRQTELGN